MHRKRSDGIHRKWISLADQRQDTWCAILFHIQYSQNEASNLTELDRYSNKYSCKWQKSKLCEIISEPVAGDGSKMLLSLHLLMIHRANYTIWGFEGLTIIKLKKKSNQKRNISIIRAVNINTVIQEPYYRLIFDLWYTYHCRM